MQFNILTLFPDLIHNYCEDSILGRAQKTGSIQVRTHNFREFSLDKHHSVDDKPFGGGPGMILQVEPIYRCLEAIGALSLRGAKRRSNPKNQEIVALSANSRIARNDKKIKIIIMDPDGKKFDQAMAQKFSKLDNLVIVCGRYEGFDERIYKFVDEKISVGDYVLAGGELPALAITEATARLVDGVLGNKESLIEETFNSVISVGDVIPAKAGIQQNKIDSRLHGNDKTASKNDKISKEYPQYTRPENFMDQKVPKILLSGDHKKIGEWRKKHSR